MDLEQVRKTPEEGGAPERVPLEFFSFPTSQTSRVLKLLQTFLSSAPLPCLLQQRCSPSCCLLEISFFFLPHVCCSTQAGILFSATLLISLTQTLQCVLSTYNLQIRIPYPFFEFYFIENVFCIFCVQFFFVPVIHEFSIFTVTYRSQMFCLCFLINISL